jgi:hypothetical protein
MTSGCGVILCSAIPFLNGTGNELIPESGAQFADSELEQMPVSSVNDVSGFAHGNPNRRFSSEFIMKTTISVNQHLAVFICAPELKLNA